jgi:hypothetical protein
VALPYEGPSSPLEHGRGREVNTRTAQNKGVCLASRVLSIGRRRKRCFANEGGSRALQRRGASGSKWLISPANGGKVYVTLDRCYRYNGLPLLTVRGGERKSRQKLEPEKSEWLKKAVFRALSEGLMTKGEAMKALGEPVDTQEPITLVERRAFLKLPMEERRKIMAKQAREMASECEQRKMEDLETGEIVEY